LGAGLGVDSGFRFRIVFRVVFQFLVRFLVFVAFRAVGGSGAAGE